MPKIPSEQLEKVTLNLYKRDVEFIRDYYGWGWSERVRDVIRAHVRSLKPKQTLTIADLIDKDDHA